MIPRWFLIGKLRKRDRLCKGFKSQIKPQGYWAYYAVHSLKDGALKQVVIDPEVEKEHIVENHLIVKSGDQIHSFVGANSTLGILVMRFDNMEQMIYMIENADEWIQIEYM